MKTRIFIALCGFLFASAVVKSEAPQIEPLKEEQFPALPVAAALKAVEMPSASLLTGAVAFEIPLYTVSVEGYELPISLKYLSNGIRKDDSQFPAGLGWSLTPGFRVVRQVRGRPDGSFARTTLNDNYSKRKELQSGSDEDVMAGSTGIDYKRYFRCMTDNFTYTEKKSERYDSEYDLFTVYLPEATINFVIIDGAVVAPPGMGHYRIRADYGLSGFHVTDPRGVVYNFTTQGTKVFKDIDHTSVVEWMLRDIDLPSGDKISFTYTGGENIYAGSFGRSTSMVTYGLATSGLKKTDQTTLYGGESQSWRINAGGSLNLDGVAFPGGKVSLIYNPERLLGDVYVIDGVDKVAHVELSYTNNNLLLKTVKDSRTGTYRFDYDERTPNNSRDWWGYCNGYQNEKTATPAMTIRKLYGEDDSFNQYGNYRTPNMTNATANILKRATYPTGGIVEWEYTMHSLNARLTDSIGIRHTGEQYFSSGGGLCVRSISLYNGPNDRKPRIRRYVYGRAGMEHSRYTAIPWPHTFIDRKEHFGLYYDVIYGDGYMLFSLLRGLLEIQQNSRYMDYQDGKLPVWCDEVTEIEAEGKTEYKFKDFIPDNRIIHEFGASFPDSLYSIFSGGPQLVEKTVYRSVDNYKYEPVLKESYDYEVVVGKRYNDYHLKRRRVQTQKTEDDLAPDFGEDSTMEWKYDHYKLMYLTIPPGVTYTKVINLENPNIGNPVFAYGFENVYTCKKYTVVPMRERLRSKTVTEYTENGPVTRREEYGYHEKRSIINEVVTSVGSDKSQLKIKYPELSDSSNLILKSLDKAIIPLYSSVEERMYMNNVVAVPIETESEINGSRVTARNEMKLIKNKVFRPGAVKIGRGGEEYTVAEYDFDSRGNLAYVRRPDSTRTVWLWGYKYRLPVYRIDGRRYGDFSAYTGGEAQGYSFTSEGLGAPVARRIYKPLVGVTEARDAAGVTTRYSYDAAGRLAESTVDGLGTTATYAYTINDGGVSRILSERWLDAGGKSRAQTMEVYDALGRPMVSMAKGGSTWSGSLTEYDGMGRPYRRWAAAPMKSETAGADEIKTSATEYHSDASPFEGTEYEASPVERVLAVTRAGAEHHDGGHRATARRLSNYGAAYRCPRYRVTVTGAEAAGDYAEGTLTVDESTDEDGVALQVFTDWRGLKVMERRGQAGAWLTTRYIHDDYGDLRYVLPPKFTGSDLSRSSDEMETLAYWYDYDVRGNVVLKKLPGRDAIRYHYDPAGRLAAESIGKIFVKDIINVRSANTRNTDMSDLELSEPVFSSLIVDRWLLHHYDSLGREAAVSEIFVEEEDDISKFASQVRTYEWDGLTDPSQKLKFDGVVKEATPLVVRHHDLAGRVVKEYAGEISRSYSYNALGQTEKLVENYNDGIVVTHTYTYTYHGEPETEHIESNKAGYRPVDSKWHYDRSGRLYQEWTDAGTGYLSRGRYRYDFPYDSVGAIKTVYDEIGRISCRQYGDRIVTDYSYNTDGTLRDVDSYSRKPMNTKYSNAPFRSRQYVSNDTINGDFIINPETRLIDPFNIIKGVYKVLSEFGDTLERRPSGRILSRRARGAAYGYEYDRYGRLSSANIGLTADATANFSTEYGYDSNSNMTSLRRYGITDRVGDSFVYGLHSEATMRYDGNQRTGITQQYYGETYEGAAGITGSGDHNISYDSRGNLDSDDSRGIKHTVYNHLNKPTMVIFNNKDTLKIRYDGLGNVVERVFLESKKMIVGFAATSITRPGSIYRKGWTENFYGPYERTIKNLTINKYPKVNFAGGYIDVDGKTYYYIHDYQGNVVAVMRGDGTVVQTAEYYPYGEPWLEPEGDNRRLFTGKERLRDLKWYDYGARMSNAASCDWTSQDKKLEEFYGYSPYCNSFCDPVNFVDESGESPTLVTAAIGFVVGGALGGGMEMLMQFIQDGKISDWRAVGGAAAQGSIVGTVTGLTGGMNLLGTVSVSMGSNMVGGGVNRAIQGDDVISDDILIDATIGGLSASGGFAVRKSLDAMSNAAKGKLGEALTKIKYTSLGYKQVKRNFEVETGRLTPVRKLAEKARYDFLFEHRLTNNRIIVDSKFNTSRFTINQFIAKDRALYPVIKHTTTSSEIGSWVQTILVVGQDGFIDHLKR